MQSHAARTIRGRIMLGNSIARSTQAAATHCLRTPHSAPLLASTSAPSLSRAFAVARHFSTASSDSKKDAAATAAPSTEASAPASVPPTAPATAPVTPESKEATALAEAARTVQAINAAHAEAKLLAHQSALERARLADPAAMRRRAAAHASSSDYSSAGSHRLLWHRSLTKREISVLVCLVFANVWILFMAWQAEDATTANAQKAGRGTKAAPARAEDRSDLQRLLDRHFTVSLDNISEGRPHTLLTASLHHRSLLHAAQNIALIMACAPGVLAATSGVRVLAGLFAGASVAGWGAELAVWDILAPPLLEGREGYPLAKRIRAALQPTPRATAATPPAATTTAPADAQASQPVGSQPPPTAEQLRAVELRRQQQLASQSHATGGPWNAGLGASPFALSLASLWLLSYHRLPLGKSPLGRFIAVMAGVTAVTDVASLAGVVGPTHTVRDSSLFVHGAGALVGALVFLRFRRHAGAAAIVKEAEVAAAARYRSMAATNAAAAAKKQPAAAAVAAADSASATGAATPARPAADAAPITAVATTPAASSSALADAAPPAAAAASALPKVSNTASPANADMRATPPRAHIGPRRPGQQGRGYATRASANAAGVATSSTSRTWVRHTQFGRMWQANAQLHATAHVYWRRR